MIYFDIKNNIIDDIISEFKYYYDLEPNIIEEFNKIIQNYNYENLKENNNIENKNK